VVRTLLFDFGNVIAYFDHRRATRRLAGLPGVSLSEPDIYRRIFETGLEPDFDAGRMTAGDFLSRLRAITGSSASDAELADAWTNIFWPNSAMNVLLPRLKTAGLRLVLASNTNALHAERFLEQFAAPLASFDDLVLSFAIHARKPERGFFDVCLERAQASADECLFVDDKREYVEAARRLGIPSTVYRDHAAFVAELQGLGVAFEAP
jgi:putative hydrolase of the HAD superfamily